jgi:hypothetical protein
MSLCNASKMLIKSMIEIIMNGEQNLENLRQDLMEYIMVQSIDIFSCFKYVSISINMKVSRDGDLITK